MIKKKSMFNTTDTLDRLAAKLEENGIKPIARVDHSKAAASANLELRPTQVLFFGNPALGTPLMQNNQLAGLELPMRVLAMEAEDGATWLCYHSPEEIAATLDIDVQTEAVSKLTAAINKLTDFAVTA